VSLTEHWAHWRPRLGGAKGRAAVALFIAAIAAVLSSWQLHYTRKYLREIPAVVEEQTSAIARLETALAEQAIRVDNLVLVQSQAGTAFPRGVPVRPRLACLTDDLVGRVKAQPSSIVDAFAACAGELRSVVGDAIGTLDEPDYFAIFATLVSFKWAPYGAGTGMTMDELQRQQVMNCGQYVAVAGKLFAYAPQSQGALLQIVGWTAARWPTTRRSSTAAARRGCCSIRRSGWWPWPASTMCCAASPSRRSASSISTTGRSSRGSVTSWSER
jgi:hypothetical protein